MHDNNEKKRIIADRDLRRACMDYEKINEHDRHTKAARRQMNHQPYQADFRSHIITPADEKTHGFNRVDDSPQIFNYV